MRAIEIILNENELGIIWAALSRSTEPSLVKLKHRIGEAQAKFRD